MHTLPVDCAYEWPAGGPVHDQLLCTQFAPAAFVPAAAPAYDTPVVEDGHV